MAPVQIPQVPQPPVQIPDVLEPVQIPLVPQSPVLIPVSHVPEPPVDIPGSQVPQSPVQIPVSQVPQPPMQILHELDTLDPLESTHAFDQLMSFVFGPQELQLLHTVPSIVDGDLLSFLDEFERELAMEPMDLTMPRLDPCVKNLSELKPSNPWICLVDITPVSYLEIWVGGPDRVTYYASEYPYTLFFEPNFGVHVPRSFGKTVIVFTSHLDLTWDTGVDLKFFRVGRFPSRQVLEAYQPQNTEANPLDLTHCSRLADVYVTWMTWLDDWEMHRDENLPWRVVCPQPWKRALETHVERL
ncbi:uncharacterized protein TNCV_1448291 [Trichonephila clavipes]|nr:uncharacterized protein TNCV_1448291 [Trichonephila clavipes]